MVLPSPLRIPTRKYCADLVKWVMCPSTRALDNGLCYGGFMNTALIEFSNGFADVVEKAGSIVVSVNEGGRTGVSGTVWRKDLVVTAEHTIRDQQEITIELPTGASSSATVVGRDPTTDIAVLRLTSS